MDDSILLDIKKLVGLEPNYTVFDKDLIIHINTVLSVLRQLGVGPAEGFSIADASATWGDFLEDNTKLEMVKTFIFTKVKPMFDPPANSFVTSMYKEEAQELEWRLNIAAEGDTKEEEP